MKTNFNVTAEQSQHGNKTKKDGVECLNGNQVLSAVSDTTPQTNDGPTKDSHDYTNNGCEEMSVSSNVQAAIAAVTVAQHDQECEGAAALEGSISQQSVPWPDTRKNEDEPTSSPTSSRTGGYGPRCSRLESLLSNLPPVRCSDQDTGDSDTTPPTTPSSESVPVYFDVTQFVADLADSVSATSGMQLIEYPQTLAEAQL